MSGAEGKVTFQKASGDSRIKIAKNGKVTVSRSLPTGSYPLTVKVTAAGNANYKAKTESVSFYFSRRLVYS